VPGPDRSAIPDHDRLSRAAALATATVGASPQDRNVASARVNTSQHVGAMGTALPSTTPGTDRPLRADLANAGGGLGLGIVQVSAIIPGFLPALILALALVAVVVVPLMALGLLVALLAVPPYGLRRLAARYRQRRSEP
jgi:hypothetical protein